MEAQVPYRGLSKSVRLWMQMEIPVFVTVEPGEEGEIYPLQGRWFHRSAGKISKSLRIRDFKIVSEKRSTGNRRKR